MAACSWWLHILLSQELLCKECIQSYVPRLLFPFPEHFLVTADVLNTSLASLMFHSFGIWRRATGCSVPGVSRERSDLIFNCRKCPVLLERFDVLRWGHHVFSKRRERLPSDTASHPELTEFSCIPIIHRKQFTSASLISSLQTAVVGLCRVQRRQ